MAGTIIINGRETGRPGIYVVPEFLNLQSRPPLSSVLAIIGDFPFLEQGVPYLSTTQSAFDVLSFSSETRKRLSNIIFNASEDSAIQSSPAGVYLISPMGVTQAIGYLYDATPTASIKIKAKQWGLEGNRTRFSIVQNASLGGWNASIRNGDYVETLRIKAEPALTTLTYTTPGTPTVPTGFGTSGGANAGSVSLAVNDGVVSTPFSVTIDETYVYTAPATTTSWTSQGPVDGYLTFNSNAPAVIDAAKSLSIKVTGISKVTGEVVTDTIPWTKVQIEAQTAVVSAIPFTGPVVVNITEATAVTFIGQIIMTGKVFPDFSAASGHTYAASVIQYISGFATAGFTATTSNTRIASAKLSDLDNLTADPFPATLNANLWKIVSTLNSKSQLVEAVRLTDVPPVITTTATAFFLAGGTETASVAADWATSLSELQFYDIDVVAPLYDPTGTDAADDTILPELVNHIETMWADGANERILWMPVGTDEDMDELKARISAFADYRISMPVDSISMIQYNNQVEDLDAYWNAVVLAACDASTNGLIPLTGRSPRITGATRNSTLYTAEAVEEMIQSGLLSYNEPPGSNPIVERDITTYVASDDPRRTERVAVRSLMLSVKFMRKALKPYIVSQDGSIPTLADVKAGVLQELERQKSFGVIKSYDPNKVVVTPYADRFEVAYEFVPRYPINFIIIRAQVSAPMSFR